MRISFILEVSPLTLEREKADMNLSLDFLNWEMNQIHGPIKEAIGITTRILAVHLAIKIWLLKLYYPIDHELLDVEQITKADR